jgi:predicted RNA-binding protein YlxR (DUF448 family)
VQSVNELKANDFEIIQQLQKNNLFERKIKKSHSDTNNELLTKLIKQAEILSFPGNSAQHERYFH